MPTFNRPVRLRTPGGVAGPAPTPHATPFFGRPVRLRRPGGSAGPVPALAVAPAATPAARPPFFGRVVTPPFADDRRGAVGGMAAPMPAPPGPYAPRGAVVAPAWDWPWWSWRRTSHATPATSRPRRPILGRVTTLPFADDRPTRIVGMAGPRPAVSRPPSFGRVVAMTFADDRRASVGGMAVPGPGAHPWPWFADDAMTGHLPGLGL